MTPRRLDPATVDAKLALLGDLVSALRQLGEPTPEQLRRDLLTRLALERALSQGVEIIVAICSHVAGSSTGAAPRTYREAITAAATLGLLDAPLAASLSRAVGMRNLLVHEYARIDVALLASAAPRARDDFEAFTRQCASWLTDR